MPSAFINIDIYFELTPVCDISCVILSVIMGKNESTEINIITPTDKVSSRANCGTDCFSVNTRIEPVTAIMQIPKISIFKN